MTQNLLLANRINITDGHVVVGDLAVRHVGSLSGTVPTTTAAVMSQQTARRTTMTTEIPNFRPVEPSRKICRSSAPDDILIRIMFRDGDDDGGDGDATPAAAITPPTAALMEDSAAAMCTTHTSSGSNDDEQIVIPEQGLQQHRHSYEYILNDVTLWIDLRFEEEIHLDALRRIHQDAPGGPFQYVVFDHDDDDQKVLETIASRSKSSSSSLSPSSSSSSSSSGRLYVHSKHGMTMESITTYAAKNWITADEMHHATTQQQLGGDGRDGQKRLIFQSLQKQGLKGLYQVILHQSKFIKHILQSIVVHLESNPNGKILVHCTLGKDRTGIISMLCQSIMGVPDEQIIHDFTKSEVVKHIAAEKMKPHFKSIDIDVTFLCGADAQTMAETLLYIRQKYGSINRYLDYAGFDDGWRRRFVAVA